MSYNFVRIHKILKRTPAMAAGATVYDDVVALIDAKEAMKDRGRGKYKTKK